MIEGDARDEGAVTRALNDCDAVISALGMAWASACINSSYKVR